MYVVGLEIEQPDCPFVETSADLDVEYHHFCLDVNRQRNGKGTVVKRGYIISKDPDELQNSIETLQSYPNFVDLQIFARSGNIAIEKVVIKFTSAMSSIINNGGYILGPFFTYKGKEFWEVGFDDEESLNQALFDLEKTNNEYKIVNLQGLPSHQDIFIAMSCINELLELIRATYQLTEKEKQTLITAIRAGYYEEPKRTSIADLAKIFGVSKVGVFKNLKRAQKKIMFPIEKLITKIDSITLDHYSSNVCNGDYPVLVNELYKLPKNLPNKNKCLKTK